MSGRMTECNGPPRKLAAGDAVAPDPNGQDLIVMRAEKDAVQLFRVPISGGAEQQIPFLTEMRLIGNWAPNAVGKDGRILVDVQSLDSWWDEVGILNPRTGKVTRLAIPYSGDILPPAGRPTAAFWPSGAYAGRTLALPPRT